MTCRWTNSGRDMQAQERKRSGQTNHIQPKHAVLRVQGTAQGSRGRNPIMTVGCRRVHVCMCAAHRARRSTAGGMVALNM